MAIRQIDQKSKDRTNCPRCGSEAIFIDARTVRWLTCPKCKFKKLMEREQPDVTVTPLIDHD